MTLVNSALHTADPREQFTTQGYSAIYQVYAGYHRDLICRRQYLSFRDHNNRVLSDRQLPKHDLPSVLARIPLDRDWEKLTQQIEAERQKNPDVCLYDLGEELLDFYVFSPEEFSLKEPKSILDSVQFIPHDQNQGYIFATVISPEGDQVWLFDANNLKQGAIAKLNLPQKINFGFTLHSEYFEQIVPRKSSYKVDRFKCAMQTLVKVPSEFFFNRRDDLLNRKVN